MVKGEGDLLTATTRHLDYFLAMTEVGKALTSSLELSAVLEVIMKTLSQLMQPSNWSLMLLDRNTNELYFEIVVGDAAEAIRNLRLPLGEGIAGWVAKHGEPVMSPDVALDPRFSRRMDDVSKFKTSSVLCVPLLCRQEVLGVIELLNEGPPACCFSQEDLQLLLPFADFAAIAIDNAHSFQKVQELTVRDEWTGLHNARYLESSLQEEVLRAERYKKPLSVVFMDLDYFKQVNDTRGHAIGSGVLREVGKVLAQLIRQTDRAIRYGGDEFVLVLPETDKAGALEFCERVRSRLAAGVLVRPNEHVELTASLGVASFPVNGTTPASLLEAADRAMYQAKETGRNAVVDASAASKAVDILL